MDLLSIAPPTRFWRAASYFGSIVFRNSSMALSSFRYLFVLPSFVLQTSFEWGVNDFKSLFRIAYMRSRRTGE